MIFTTGSQLLNNTSILKLHNCHQVIYNRLPKCGSRSILRTFDALAKQNEFNQIKKVNWNGYTYFPTDEVKVVFLKCILVIYIEDFVIIMKATILFTKCKICDVFSEWIYLKRYSLHGTISIFTTRPFSWFPKVRCIFQEKCLRFSIVNTFNLSHFIALDKIYQLFHLFLTMLTISIMVRIIPPAIFKIVLYLKFLYLSYVLLIVVVVFIHTWNIYTMIYYVTSFLRS